MCFLRDRVRGRPWRPSGARPYLEQDHRRGPRLGRGRPPAVEVQEVFAGAREHGLSAVAHAGEEGPPEYVWQALDVLGSTGSTTGPVRGGPGLVARLGGTVPLTVCPLPTCGCASSTPWRPPAASDAGRRAVVTVNSDDPAYFGGYVDDNYTAVSDGLGFSREEFRAVAENSFKASFLSEGEKKGLLEELGALLRDVRATRSPSRAFALGNHSISSQV